MYWDSLILSILDHDPLSICGCATPASQKLSESDPARPLSPAGTFPAPTDSACSRHPAHAGTCSSTMLTVLPPCNLSRSFKEHGSPIARLFLLYFAPALNRTYSSITVSSSAKPFAAITALPTRSASVLPASPAPVIPCLLLLFGSQAAESRPPRPASHPIEFDITFGRPATRLPPSVPQGHLNADGLLWDCRVARCTG